MSPTPHDGEGEFGFGVSCAGSEPGFIMSPGELGFSVSPVLGGLRVVGSKCCGTGLLSEGGSTG